KDGSALCCLDERFPAARGGPQARVNRIVLRPGRFDGAREGEDVFSIETIVGGWSGRVPVAAVFDGVLRVRADERPWIRVVGRAPDVLKAPVEGLDAAVVVGGPAAMLVAADFTLKEIHLK